MKTAKGADEKIEIVDRDNTQKDRLGLKVIAKETGEAIENAQINVRLYSNATKTSDGKTDQFGRIDVLLGDEELISLSITVKVDGRVPTKISYRDEGEAVAVPLNYTLALERGTSIGGIINNKQGKPVQEVSVSLLVPSRPAKRIIHPSGIMLSRRMIRGNGVAILCRQSLMMSGFDWRISITLMTLHTGRRKSPR